MNGNQHATEAAALLAVNPGEYEIEKSKALATLALAYEQRTANLIAFERTQWDAWRRDELKPEGVELWTKAANQITERLDLA
jgi:hypothetical protein